MDKKRFMRDQVIADILCNGDPEQEIALLHELIDVELTKTDQEMDCDFISACVRQIYELEGRELETGITPEPRLFAKRAQKKSLRKKIVRAAVVFLSFCVGLFALNGISVTALNVNIIDGLYQWTNRGVFFHEGPDGTPSFASSEILLEPAEVLLEKMKEAKISYAWLPMDIIREIGGVSDLSATISDQTASISFGITDPETDIKFIFNISHDSTVPMDGQRVRSWGIPGEFDQNDKIEIDGITMYLFGGKSGVRAFYEEETEDHLTTYFVSSAYRELDFDFNRFKEIMKSCQKVVISE